MAAPLMGRRPKRRAKAPTRTCMACPATIASWKWLCDACFKALPRARKSEICRAREDRNPPKIFGLSRSAADWLTEQRIKQVEGQ